MLYTEEGLKVQKTEEEQPDDEEDGQIKERPLRSDQNISRNSYVYANEE